MRYRLKFGDTFAAQKYQMCVIGENPAKFSRPSLHALLVEVWRRFAAQKYISVESAGKFSGPSLHVSIMRYQLKLGDAFVGQNFKRQDTSLAKVRRS